MSDCTYCGPPGKVPHSSACPTLYSRAPQVQRQLITQWQLGFEFAGDIEPSIDWIPVDLGVAAFCLGWLMRNG